MNARPSSRPWPLARIVAVTALLMLACGVAAAQTFTPLEWQPRLGNRWVNDHNDNDVDDWIESLRPDTTLGLVLALNDCASTTDLQRFATKGTIKYRSPYLSVVVMGNVRASDAVLLGADPRVAMVFPELRVHANLDHSVGAMQVRASPDYSPNTIADQMPWLDGSGVTIAILDTGVDDGQHESLPVAKYVGGYDFLNNVIRNPDDDNHHGTHVAGIALGTGGLMGTYRGVARNARLVDFKVLDNTGGGPVGVALRAIDSCITMRQAWGIRVINASFGVDQYAPGVDAPSNGEDPLSEMFDRASRAGICVAVAAGNSGRALIGWGPAARQAITVGACTTQNTYTRADDIVASFSSRGPLQDVGAPANQKPDVSAPGTNVNPSPALPAAGIMSAQFNTLNQYMRLPGTSMAAPHVAGLAALLVQLRPALTPWGIKQTLIATADAHGGPAWDAGWGHGEVNGFAAVAATIADQADVGFSVWCHRAGNPVWWETPDVRPNHEHIEAGVANTILCRVHNYGPVPAAHVEVRVGVYNFGNDDAMHDLCDDVISYLDVNADTVLTCDWTPIASGPGPTVHACIKAEIEFPTDPNPTNNCAQHNMEIVVPAGGQMAAAATTAGVSAAGATTVMQIVNPTPEGLSMDVHDVAGQITGSGWTLNQSTYGVWMNPGDCAVPVTITLTPGTGARDSVRVALQVTGYATSGHVYELGGASVISVLPTPLDAGDRGVSGRLDFAITPNPSRAAAAIELDVPRAGAVALAVFDAAGRRVRTLIDGRLEAGHHRIAWDGMDGAGRAVASGVYWVRVGQNGVERSRVLLRVR